MSAPDTIEPAVDETGAEETGAGEELSDRDKAAATLASLLPTGAAEAAAAVEDANKAAEPKLDAQGRAYATGKRKDAVARVWIKRGNWQDHHQWPRRSKPISPRADPAHDHEPATAGSVRNGKRRV